MSTKQEGQKASIRDTYVDVIEAPDGVLTVRIRTGRPAKLQPSDLLSRPRRAPKRVH